MSVDANAPTDRYDRAAAAAVLAAVAGPGLFGSGVDERFLGGPRRIDPELVPMVSEPGSHLNAAQLDYLRSRMRPCGPEMVTSATHRVRWHDSDGIVNVAHCGPSDLGPVVLVVARETTLALWRALAADKRLVAGVAAVSTEGRVAMTSTTTDREPVEILRVGLDTTARALVQHAWLADQTPYRDAAVFARGLRDSGIFAMVANTWFWGLQSSTFRRGMIPASLMSHADSTVRYTSDSAAMLRAMKDAAISDAKAVMRRATAEEGLSIEQALRKYDRELGVISKQYALLPTGEHPRCLANMTAVVDGRRFTVLPGVVDTFVETFVRLLELVEVVGAPDQREETGMDTTDQVFEVPDMTCSHCTNTTTAVLESHGIVVNGIDLDTKQVVAAFPNAEVRDQCFEAIRGRGYTVIPPDGC
ncbi:copper chaperone [Kribbella catacumbae]|uniref:copper chaperone n=1 Tax=Kribbella catacumbae TaxID=460086 RepID=UPI0012FC0FD8|nr:copper chaperone [Kribbella catacumbae]